MPKQQIQLQNDQFGCKADNFNCKWLLQRWQALLWIWTTDLTAKISHYQTIGMTYTMEMKSNDVTEE